MMEYNNYYPVHHGQPPPPPNIMSNQSECSPMRGQMMTPNGPQMMQPSPAPSTPHSMQQTPSPMPTQQQHMGSVLHQQPSPHHSNYHQLPQHPPISHSASPHPSSTPHSQQPPPRPSTGPSPLHHQSPIHMNGPSPKLHSVSHHGPPSQPQTPVPGWASQPQHMHAHSTIGSSNFNHQISHMSQSHNYMSSSMQPHAIHQYGHSQMNQHGSSHQSHQMHHHGNQVHVGPSNQHQTNIVNRGLISPHIPQHVQQQHQQHQNIQQQHQQHLQTVDASSTSPIERGSPFYQQIPQTEFRMIKLNKRLQNRPRRMGPQRTLPIDELDESAWWVRFACDFFDDEAVLSLQIPGEDKPSEYKIGRTMIPRFFKSYFDGGVTDFSIKLRNIRESTYRPGFITLDCDQTDITTKNYLRLKTSDVPLSVVVHTEGHLRVEFVSNGSENLLIRSWKFYANQCHEYVDRSMISASKANSYLVEPVTRFGLTKNTFAFLKMCMIMEPMQDLMLQHRQTNMDPRTCLKKLLYDRYNLKNVDEARSQPTKRRRVRKTAAEGGASSSKKSKARNINSNAVGSGDQMNTSNAMQAAELDGSNQHVLMTSQDVLIVGEPILGADFGDENERRATRLENNQYDPSTLIDSMVDNSTKQTITDNASITSQRVIDKLTLGTKMEPQQQQHHHRSMNSNDLPKHTNCEKDQQNTTHDNNSYSELNGDTIISVNQNYDIEQSGSKVNIKCNNDEHHETSDVNLGTSSSSKDTTSPTSNIVVVNDQTSIIEESLDEPPRPSSEGPAGKENNEESLTANSIDSLKSIASGSSKTVGIVPSNKQNRRRSSERKETLREGLMRTSDFVVAMKDLKLEHPSLWRITTGNNLLQQFEPKTLNGVILFENTNQYAGWNPEIRKDYVGVDVRLTQHTRNQITVERLLLNFQKIEDAEAFYDRHFSIYIQILISTVLDAEFWDGIENELKHHDYFITSRRIVDDIIKRYKLRLAGRLKLGEYSLKDFEKYPNLIIKPQFDGNPEKAPICRACNSNLSTQQVRFENRSYDLHTFKPVKVTSEAKAKDQRNYNLCDGCLELVRLFSDIHHMGWKFFNMAREKVDKYKAKGKPINTILDECLKDEDWMTKVFAERDTIWSKVDQLQGS